MKNSSFLTMCSFGLTVFAVLFLEDVKSIAVWSLAALLGVAGIICDTIEKSNK